MDYIALLSLFFRSKTTDSLKILLLLTRKKISLGVVVLRECDVLLHSKTKFKYVLIEKYAVVNEQLRGKVYATKKSYHLLIQIKKTT